MCVSCFKTVVYLLIISSFMLIDKNKINPALHIYSGEKSIGTMFWKIKEFFFITFLKEHNVCCDFKNWMTFLNYKVLIIKSSVNNIPLEGYENKIGMHGPWLFLRGLLEKSLHFIVTFLFQYQCIVCL